MKIWRKQSGRKGGKGRETDERGGKGEMARGTQRGKEQIGDRGRGGKRVRKGKNREREREGGRQIGRRERDKVGEE